MSTWTVSSLEMQPGDFPREVNVLPKTEESEAEKEAEGQGRKTQALRLEATLVAVTADMVAKKLKWTRHTGWGWKDSTSWTFDGRRSEEDAGGRVPVQKSNVKDDLVSVPAKEEEVERG